MIRLKSICCIFLSLSLLACKKTPEVKRQTNQGVGIVRPVGQPAGHVIQKVIGAGGGSVISGDGQLAVEIPAGALNADVAIAIEPITRTLVDGVENKTMPAYRITPHGQSFLKPVKISFRFSAGEFKKITSATAKIAYQDSNGKWIGLNKSLVDTVSKIVSVQATHFSDWTVYESVYLEPTGVLSVEVNKSVTLKVMTVTPLTLTQSELNNEELYLDEPSEIPLPVDWRIVNGSNNGTIVNVPTRPVAIYTAPGSVPNHNPVEVEAKVNLKSHGHLYLLKNILVTEPVKPGIHLRINGGAWIHFNDTESFNSNESYVGSEGDFPFDQHAIYIRIAGGNAKGTGSWAWDDLGDEENSTTFEYIVNKPAPHTVYQHRYTNNDFDIWHMSPGGIRITEYKQDEFGDTWATGDFNIEKSTPFIEGVNGTPPPVQIKGNFKLRVE